jgi:hypothetical protein
VIVWALWRRGLLRRALNAEKARFFLGSDPDPLTMSRRYPLWRALSVARLLLVPTYAVGVARWIEYRMNLYDGIEG